MPTLLWWGRSDTHYSRNQIILKLFKKHGWNINYYRPVSSALGKAQAFLLRPNVPDLIWVPCFRQRDAGAAIFWAQKWDCPLIFDPLISAYQKEVFEKQRWRTDQSPARKLLDWEANLFNQADLVIADTRMHAEFYCKTFKLDPRRVTVIHVGADEQMFAHQPIDLHTKPLEVFFYGSFLPLHGPEVIIEAAKQLEDTSIQWVLLGDGDSRARVEKKANGMKNVRFEQWIKYDRLPQRISNAQIVLGIFGGTPKASMVIPNKVFQTMAVGRPLITMASEAYPFPIQQSQTIGWVPPEDPKALADRVRQWSQNKNQLAARGAQTRELYDRFFSQDHIFNELKKALSLVQ